MKNKITIYLSLIVTLTTCLLLSPALTMARDFTSIELIDRVYRNGGISYSDALNYKVSAVLNPNNLPLGFKSKIPLKSGTPIIMEARLNKHLLSTENARLLARGRNDTITALYRNEREHTGVLSRELTDSDGTTPLYRSGVIVQSIISPAKHFRIHYTTDNTNCDPNTLGSCDAVPTIDTNNNNIPDYVEKFADILDNVWKKEIDELGYDAPPSDGTEGGDCLLDVYLADLDAYGYTQVDTGKPASTVYMIFENDFAGFPSSQEDSMKVTAAHEFFHTIQFQIADDPAPLGCYDCQGWWMEASATWMEDQIYPDANDYVNYLDQWFQHQELPLYTYGSGIFQYGTSVWIKHMTEKYGSKFVYDVWNDIKNNKGDTPIPAIENVLVKNNSSLAEELKELRVANLTYTYDDGQIYKDWSVDNPVAVLFDPVNSIYPNCDISQNLFDNFSASKNINCSLDTLTAKYFAFTPPASGSGTLNIAFDGDSNISIMVVGFLSSDTAYDVTELLTDPGNHTGSIAINGFSSGGPYKKVVIVLLNYAIAPGAQKTFHINVSNTSSSSATLSSLEIKPASASVVAEDLGYGKHGKQQYYVIMKDNSNQVLKSGTGWSVIGNASINSYGVATLSNAVTATITASLGGLNPSGSITASNPVTMTPGATRDCDANSLTNTTTDSSTRTGGDKRCFIATAAFGSPLHPYVKILREFRDKYLLTNSAGSNFVSIYYYYSPYIAGTIEKYAILKTIVRISLIPAIMFSGFMVKTTIAEKVVVGIFIFITIVILSFLLNLDSRLHGNDRRKPL